MYSVYSVVHINHELHIRGSSDAQRADTKLWSFIFHQLFKQHNRLQAATQVGGSSYPHPMRKNLSNLPFKQSHISASPPRTSLIVKANNAITVIPPTPSSNPNSLYPNSGGTTHRTTHKRTQYPTGRGKEVQKIYNSGTRFK